MVKLIIFDSVSQLGPFWSSEQCLTCRLGFEWDSSSDQLASKIPISEISVHASFLFQ